MGAAKDEAFCAERTRRPGPAGHGGPLGLRLVEPVQADEEHVAVAGGGQESRIEARAGVTRERRGVRGVSLDGQQGPGAAQALDVTRGHDLAPFRLPKRDELPLLTRTSRGEDGHVALDLRLVRRIGYGTRGDLPHRRTEDAPSGGAGELPAQRLEMRAGDLRPERRP